MSFPTLKSKVLSHIDRLLANGELAADEWYWLLSQRSNTELQAMLAERAQAVCIENYGRRVFLRGLIEFTNICKNNCLYCGIRRDNKSVERYRLTPEQVLACCESGYAAGFRTFVLQGGEDPFWSDEKLVPLVQEIHQHYPDCAVTLSVGERSRESYEALYAAGAERYLLRHETASYAHYNYLHPKEMSQAQRLACLADLREIGFQTGCGLMVGSPGQKTSHLVEDFLYMQVLQPHMVGIGPFLPQHDTPFRNEKAGSVNETLFILSLVRLMLPKVLLPATTALNSAEENGHIMGLLAGCNVIMPNLSPPDVRRKYALYDGKRFTGDEAGEHVSLISARVKEIGYEAVVDRGDHLTMPARS